MTPSEGAPPMTTNAAPSAREIAAQIASDFAECGLVGECRSSIEAAITAAESRGERRGLERAQAVVRAQVCGENWSNDCKGGFTTCVRSTASAIRALIVKE